MHGTYQEFQGRIDDAFDKNNPNASVPWSESPPPHWAAGFRPRVIIDLGCATARFTTAVLARLGGWGCLGDLEKLVLIEEEPHFGSSDPSVFEKIRARCLRVLSRYGKGDVEIQLVNERATVEPNAASAASEIRLGPKRMPSSDLIIASHVSYYFANCGAELIHALSSGLDPMHGLAWVVARKRECPLYQGRIRALAEMDGQVDECDYAENLAPIIHGTPDLEILEERDLAFLASDKRPANCAGIAYLLMWRTPLEAAKRDAKFQSAVSACHSPEPLYSERHFILAKRAG